MRAAPSVSYPLGFSLFHRNISVVLLVGALLVGLGWSASQAFHWAQYAAAIVWLAACICLWRAGQPCGSELQWDGSFWWLNQAELRAAVEPVLHLDFSVALLLRLKPSSHITMANPTDICRWVWLEERFNPSLWGDVRRALVAQRSSTDINGENG